MRKILPCPFIRVCPFIDFRKLVQPNQFLGKNEKYSIQKYQSKPIIVVGNKQKIYYAQVKSNHTHQNSKYLVPIDEKILLRLFFYIFYQKLEIIERFYPSLCIWYPCPFIRYILPLPDNEIFEKVPTFLFIKYSKFSIISTVRLIGIFWKKLKQCA